MIPHQKYYVSKNDSITIRCHVCKKARTFPVAGLKLKKHTLKVQCPCANTFFIDIEFRKSYRKKIDITGKYRKKAELRTEERPCIVSDISLGGLGITITGDPALQVTDELVVTFIPSTLQHSEIDTVLRVRHVEPGKIGGEFIDSKKSAENEIISLFLQ